MKLYTLRTTNQSSITEFRRVSRKHCSLFYYLYSCGSVLHTDMFV